MKSLVIGSLLLTTALSTVTAATLDRARTSAEVLESSSRLSIVQIEFVSIYQSERPLSPVNDDVLVSWQQVGGIDPTPFNVLLPAGCFEERKNFRVRDYESCGAKVDFGTFGVEVLDLDARIILSDDGSIRLDIRVDVFPGGNASAELLGTLAGARVDVAIGAESAGLLPKSIQSVSGVQPTPF